MPPALGQSRMACACLRDEILGTNSFSGYEKWDQSVSEWGDIALLRNKAAHPGVMDVESADTTQRKLKSLAQIEFFNRTQRMKTELEQDHH